MTILEVNNVRSGYGRMEILHAVTLHVEQGSVTVVVGPNGAGKTTLMKTIMGILPLMEGDVKYKGESIGGLEATSISRKGIGYVPQEGNVFVNLSVKENLEIGGFCLNGSAVKARMEEMLEWFPVLKERSRQRAGTLSGGERQMLAIACALMSRPDLLLLDEPTTGLSPHSTRMVMDHLRQVRGTSLSILWVVGENPAQLLREADRIYLLESGVVRKSYYGASFLEDEHFAELFLGMKK